MITQGKLLQLEGTATMDLFKRKLIQVDQETGEIEPGIAVLIPKRQKLRGEFMLASSDGFLRLAKEPDLTGADRRVLDVLMANLDFENYILLNHEYIAEYLEMRKQNVSRSIVKLVDKGILVRGAKSGKHNTYRLNAFFGWKGRISKKYQDAYEEHTKLIN